MIIQAKTNDYFAFCPLLLSRILYKSPVFVQNKPNLENPQNHRKLRSHKWLRQYTPLRLRQKQTQTNPNKANPTPIFRSLWHPKAKTNPSKPKANPTCSEPVEPTCSEPVESIYRGEAGTNPYGRL
jgi:hypothetical protein